MTVLLLLAAVIITPAALLVLAGPGELELMTTPKNLGVLDAEIAVRPRPVVSVTDVVCSDVNSADVARMRHAACIPAGLRVGVDA